MAWAAVALAFPIAGYIGWQISGPVDTVETALIGGALTGAGLAAVQWWAAKGALGGAAAWISAGAAGYGVGLAVGATLVGYGTDIGSLALMGPVSGASLGAAQGLALARQGNRRLATAWGAAMPVLFTLGWVAAAGLKRVSTRPLSSMNSTAPAAPNTVNWFSTLTPMAASTRVA